MSQITKNEKWQFVLLAILVFLSRLPFLANGFGIDGDSWSVAITAKQLHDTGLYVPSRLPGFPVHEFLCSLAVNYGYIGLNIISAFFSAAGVLFFALTLRVLRFKYVFLASVTLALVPVYYINSTATIDYVVAIGFILAAMYFLLRGKLIWAGILIGLATGTRITSGAMLIPFSILLIENDGLKNNVRRILRLFLPAIIISILVFLPVMMKYGSGFFRYYDVPYPSIAKVLYKFSIEVWGVVGILGIVISTALILLPDRITLKKFLFPRAVNEKFVIAWLVAIDLYIIAFLKLPMESGYLIPIIPFVILIFGKYLYNKAFVFFCLMLMSSSLICTISPVERYDAATPSRASFSFNAAGEKLNFDLIKGPVLSFETRRRNGVHFVDDLIKSTDTIGRKSVLAAGKWYNQMFVQCGDTSKLKISLRDYLSEDEAVYFYAKGYTIYYLPKQDEYNKIMRNVDLEIYRALPYIH